MRKIRAKDGTELIADEKTKCRQKSVNKIAGFYGWMTFYSDAGIEVASNVDEELRRSARRTGK